jgi:phosphotransferase system HPr-like phosphotransfer protein
MQKDVDVFTLERTDKLPLRFSGTLMATYTLSGVLSAGNNINIEVQDGGIHVSAGVVESPDSFLDSINVEWIKIRHDDNGNSCQFRLKVLGIKENDEITIDLDGTDAQGQKLTETCTLTNDYPTYDTVFYYRSCMASIKSRIESVKGVLSQGDGINVEVQDDGINISGDMPIIKSTME